MLDSGARLWKIPFLREFLDEPDTPSWHSSAPPAFPLSHKSSLRKTEMIGQKYKEVKLLKETLHSLQKLTSSLFCPFYPSLFKIEMTNLNVSKLSCGKVLAKKVLFIIVYCLFSKSWLKATLQVTWPSQLACQFTIHKMTILLLKSRFVIITDLIVPRHNF